MTLEDDEIFGDDVPRKDSTDDKLSDYINKANTDLYCGIGQHCRSPTLQRCANIVCFTVAASFSMLSTSTLSIYINSQITTLERQFGFSSSVSGILMSCNDFGYLLTTLIFSYYARKTHIPRVLAASTLLFGLSGLLCTIPFLASREDIPSPSYLPSSEPLSSNPVNGMLGLQLCILDNQTESPLTPNLQELSAASHSLSDVAHNSSSIKGENFKCAVDIQGDTSVKSAMSEQWRGLAIAFLALGMILQGIGKSPRTAYIGIYIDDNVDHTKTSFYLGIIMACSILGPALAFALGGVFTKIYVTLEATDMSPRDPRWIGAWWLGFVLFGILGVLTAVPLLFFPKRLRAQPHLPTASHKVVNKVIKPKQIWQEIKGFLATVLQLIINPVYILVVLSNCWSLFGVSGLLAFLPKYFETQFFIPAWQANIALGVMNVSAASLGTFVGGAIVSRLKLSPRKCLVMMIITTCISMSFSLIGFYTGCHQPHISKGVYSSPTNASCKTSCSCDDTKFFPTCGADGVNYFSPCHAGCSESLGNVFAKCSCVDTPLINSTVAIPEAKPGFCAPDCQMLYVYIVLMFFGAFFATLCVMPGFVVFFRCVPEASKPLSIGLQAFLTNLLGWFPGPVTLGRVVDSACLMWSSGCSGTGSCTLYDIEAFRFRFHALFNGTKTLQLVFLVIALAIGGKKMASGEKSGQILTEKEFMLDMIHSEDKGEFSRDNGKRKGGAKIYKGNHLV